MLVFLFKEVKDQGQGCLVENDCFDRKLFHMEYKHYNPTYLTPDFTDNCAYRTVTVGASINSEEYMNLF